MRRFTSSIWSQYFWMSGSLILQLYQLPHQAKRSHYRFLGSVRKVQIRRFTRLTNAFSKKWENHYAALTLYFAYYNLVRIHGATRVTPAMEAGIADHIWTIEELLSKIGR
jgi:hypothetical protein